MNKKIISKAIILSTLFFFFIFGCKNADAKTYKISPSTKPCDKSNKSSYYNKNTKAYFTIRSYIRKIGKSKKGTLVLKKGTYKLSNTIFIPSNTTIILENGATIKKISKSGVKAMPASTTIFQLVPESKAQRKSAVGKHNGSKNITIKGNGKATIDLDYCKSGSQSYIGIIMGHNQNVNIENITLKNMRYGHLIEVDACKNVYIKNCTFTGYKTSGKYNKEAINLDTPDKMRDGFNAPWSKKDKTSNININISNCTFNKLEAGVGTHRYTGGSYHTNVTIKDCSFSKCQTAIRVLNWKNATITNNTFTNCKPNQRYKYAFFVAGALGLNMTYNTFTNCGTCGDTRNGLQLMEFWWDAGYDAKQTIYSPTRSIITVEQANLFATTNKGINCGIIRSYNTKAPLAFPNVIEDESNI